MKDIELEIRMQLLGAQPGLSLTQANEMIADIARCYFEIQKDNAACGVTLWNQASEGSVLELWQFAFDKPPRHCKLLRMARPLRVPYPGAVYHVKARGNHGQPIFADNPDRERFLETLEEAC